MTQLFKRRMVSADPARTSDLAAMGHAERGELCEASALAVAAERVIPPRTLGQVDQPMADARPTGLRHAKMLDLIRQETIPMATKWTWVAPKTFSVPVRKLAQVLLIAGSMTLGGAATATQGEAEIEAPASSREMAKNALRERAVSDYSKRVMESQQGPSGPSVESARAAASEQALPRAGWRDHAILVLGFAVIGAAFKGLSDSLGKGLAEGREDRRVPSREVLG